MSDDLLDDEPARNEKAPDPVETLILPLWRARWLIGACAFVGVCGGTFLAATQPNQFDSVGKLLLRTGARESATPESRLIGEGGTPQISGHEAVSNEIHLLTDPAMFRRVVMELGPARIFTPYAPEALDAPGTPLPVRWLHAFQSYWFARGAGEKVAGGHAVDNCESCVRSAAEALASSVRVFAEPGSSVLTVLYSSHSPQLAAEVVDAFMQAALAQHKEVFGSFGTLSFLEQQVREAQATADIADSELARYRVECRIFDLEGQRSQTFTELQALDAELAANAARLAELRALEEFLEDMLTTEPDSIDAIVEPGPMLNPEHTWLAQRLLELRGEELELTEPIGGTVEQFEARRARHKQQVELTEAALAKQPRFLELAARSQSSVNPRRERLVERVQGVRGDRLALEQSTSMRQDRILALKQELTHLEVCRPQLFTLEHALEQAQNKLQQLAEARDRAGMLSLLDQLAMTNLRVLQSANTPITKSGPNRGRLLFMGCFLGAAVGMTFAMLIQWADRRVRRSADLESLTGLPVLAVVPRQKLRRTVAARR